MGTGVCDCARGETEDDEDSGAVGAVATPETEVMAGPAGSEAELCCTGLGPTVVNEHKEFARAHTYIHITHTHTHAHHTHTHITESNIL